jgi:autoinducer 2 (AI-2) kinase
VSTFDIPAAILPTVRRAGERVGSVTAAAAAATGLRPGTPVYIGGADTQCSLLGAGAIEPGATAATLGTTTPVQAVVSAAVFDPDSRLWAGCHVVPDRWVLESNAGDTGDAYLWILDLVSGGAPREQLYKLGEQLAADRFGPPTMLFVGPALFDLSKMRFNRPGGMLFPFPALHVRPDRATLVRAFMENIAYALRGNIEQIQAITKQQTPVLTVSGGMTRSGVLARVITDVTGLPVRVAREPESAALGCAMLIAAGESGGFASAVDTMVQHVELDPDAAQRERYEAPYAKWRELHERLDGIEV